jgi:hypothetical protein
MARTLDPLQFVLMAMAGWMNQRQQQVIEYLQEENRVLREQTGKRRLRFTDDQRRRLAVKAKVLGRRALAELDTLVMPDTLLNWHRKLIAEKYDGSAQRRPGRPQVRGEIQHLVILARENRTWGYRRIQGALSHVGFKLAVSTIAEILRRHGIEPAPERSRKTSWKEISEVGRQEGRSGFFHNPNETIHGICTDWARRCTGRFRLVKLSR